MTKLLKENKKKWIAENNNEETSLSTSFDLIRLISLLQAFLRNLPKSEETIKLSSKNDLWSILGQKDKFKMILKRIDREKLKIAFQFKYRIIKNKSIIKN